MHTMNCLISAGLAQACDELQVAGRSARQRALNRLDAAAITAQSTVARGCTARAVARVMRKRREADEEQARLDWAIVLLQSRQGRLEMT